MYNRYIHGEYFAPEDEHKEPSKTTQAGSAIKEKPLSRGESGGAVRLLPEGIDTGDIMLLMLLLLLYTESGDEDFLIILIVLAFGLFRRE